MPPTPRRIDDWAKAPAALALAISVIGVPPAALWGLIAGLWTFGTKDYASFSGVIATMAVLIGLPILGLGAAMKGRPRLALLFSIPSLVLYGVTLIILTRR